MSNGVYVLINKDGYRVAYSDSYDAFFTGYDKDMNYVPDAVHFKRIFGKSEVFADEASVLNAAYNISKLQKNELDDGVMFINNYPDLTFEELTSGDKT